MSEEIEIRTYRPEDAAPLRAMLFDAFTAGELHGSTRNDVERWHTRLPGDPADTLVAVLSGQPAGLITLGQDHIVVERAFRRQGIGTRLVEAAERQRIERGFGPLVLALPRDNAGARAFFAALGFRYHHSYWLLRLREGTEVPPPVFPPEVVRHHYRSDDLVPFVDLVNTVFLDHPTPLVFTIEQVRYVHRLPTFDPDDLCLLAPSADRNTLIAFCRSIREEDGDRRLAHVTILGVDRAWRGQGLARELLRWAIHRARSFDVTAISITVEGENERALRLYEQTGFERVEEWPRYCRGAF